MPGITKKPPPAAASHSNGIASKLAEHAAPIMPDEGPLWTGPNGDGEHSTKWNRFMATIDRRQRATSDGAAIAIANTLGMTEAQSEMIWDSLPEWRQRILWRALEEMHWMNDPAGV